MSTRGCIARLTRSEPPAFAGRYHHWDSYPTGLGRTLWSLYHGHFGHDLSALLRVLLDDHPAGWSSINGADFALAPGFDEFPFPREATLAGRSLPQRPVCYCHGDRAEEPQLLTQENAAACGCEWAYAFALADQPRHHLLLVMASYTPRNHKMVGWFGQGDPEAHWRITATVALEGPEPDWSQIERAGACPPVPPFSPCHLLDMALSPAGGEVVAVYELPSLWGLSHYVALRSEASCRGGSCQDGLCQDGACESSRYYCSCSAANHSRADETDAPPPVPSNCGHIHALQEHLEQRRAEAKRRLERGLCFTGQKLECGNLVLAWEAGVARPLDPADSPLLARYAGTGFDWQSGSSGLSRLALALLLESTGDDELALRRHRALQEQLLSAIPPQASSWSLSGETLTRFLNAPREPLLPIEPTTGLT